MRKICIFNYKGGVGKTTTAINLAAGLSRQDKKVLLVDLDPQGNIDASLKAKSEFNLYDALTGKLPVQQCIVNIGKNFDIITSKESLIKAEYYMAKQEESRLILKDLLEKIKGYDYIIIDCPPSLGLLNQNALTFCNEVFVPVSTDFLSYDALGKMKNIINEVKYHYGSEAKITKIIPTLYDKRNKICRDMLIAIQQDFPELTAYPIRVNSKIKEAPMHGKSIFSHAKSSIGADDYGQLVDDVLIMSPPVSMVAKAK